MTKSNIALLLGDPELLSVERAVSELRAGRPVALRHAGGDLLVTAFESLDEMSFSAMKRVGAPVHLVLSSARLRHLKQNFLTAGSISVADFGLDKIEEIVSGKEASLEGPAPVATPGEQMALELVRLSLLLPAAVVMRLDALNQDDISGLAVVQATAVSTFQSTAVETLRIVSRAPVPLEGVETCEFVIFRGGEGMRDQIAVIIGKPDVLEPVSVRIHSACLTGDLFGSLKCDCGDQLRGAVQRMAEAGGGLLLYLDQEGRGNGIANKIRAYYLQHQGHDTYDADQILGFENDHRRFDMAAEMIHQLGFSSVRLMTNNPLKIKALQDGGLNVVATQRVIGRANGHSAGYIAAKRDRAGHLFDKDKGEVLLRTGNG